MTRYQGNLKKSSMHTFPVFPIGSSAWGPILIPYTAPVSPKACLTSTLVPTSGNQSPPADLQPGISYGPVFLYKLNNATVLPPARHSFLPSPGPLWYSPSACLYCYLLPADCTSCNPLISWHQVTTFWWSQDQPHFSPGAGGRGGILWSHVVTVTKARPD